MVLHAPFRNTCYYSRGLFWPLLCLLMQKKVKKSPLEKLEHALQIPVGYIIMPVFALANTNITYKSGMIEGLSSSLGVGVV